MLFEHGHAAMPWTIGTKYIATETLDGHQFMLDALFMRVPNVCEHDNAGRFDDGWSGHPDAGSCTEHVSNVSRIDRGASRKCTSRRVQANGMVCAETGAVFCVPTAPRVRRTVAVPGGPLSWSPWN